MGPVRLALLERGLLELDRFGARFGQPRVPAAGGQTLVVQGRRGITAGAHVEQEARDRPEIVGQKIAVASVEGQNSLPHRKVVLPAPELDL